MYFKKMCKLKMLFYKIKNEENAETFLQKIGLLSIIKVYIL